MADMNMDDLEAMLEAEDDNDVGSDSDEEVTKFGVSWSKLRSEEIHLHSSQ